MAVFSVASGSSAAGGSSARISSGLRGSFRRGLCSLPLMPIPAVMAFHKALWDFEPADGGGGRTGLSCVTVILYHVINKSRLHLFDNSFTVFWIYLQNEYAEVL